MSDRNKQISQALQPENLGLLAPPSHPELPPEPLLCEVGGGRGSSEHINHPTRLLQGANEIREVKGRALQTEKHSTNAKRKKHYTMSCRYRL